jgi:hypothetical protein
MPFSMRVPIFRMHILLARCLRSEGRSEILGRSCRATGEPEFFTGYQSLLFGFDASVSFESMMKWMETGQHPGGNGREVHPRL